MPEASTQTLSIMCNYSPVQRRSLLHGIKKANTTAVFLMAKLVAMQFITMCILQVSEDISPGGTTYDVTLTGREHFVASFQVFWGSQAVLLG